jgi:UDP-N-acetylglucosamine--N-acetylmuramyl-(pentapeptide) pyrophosphoryl-undecaprenol N-acetylglucosamine transferase
VAEDHQTKNAMALSTKNAAILIKDSDAENTLISTAIKTVNDKSLLESLGTNAGKMALHDSANIIAKEVYKLAMEHNKD